MFFWGFYLPFFTVSNVNYETEAYLNDNDKLLSYSPLELSRILDIMLESKAGDVTLNQLMYYYYLNKTSFFPASALNIKLSNSATPAFSLAKSVPLTLEVSSFGTILTVFEFSRFITWSS